MSKMTKQQAISLKLAQWLGKEDVSFVRDRTFFTLEYECVHIPVRKEFNPFANSIEGRAQFAECLLRAWSSGLHVDKYSDFVRSWSHGLLDIFKTRHDNSPEGIIAATLEAIYYAIGGEKIDHAD